MFEEAGFAEVGVVTERLDIDLPPMREFVPKMIEAIGCAPLFEALSEAEKAEVIERVRGSVSESAAGHGATARMTAVVSSGRTS